MDTTPTTGAEPGKIRRDNLFDHAKDKHPEDLSDVKTLQFRCARGRATAGTCAASEAGIQVVVAEIIFELFTHFLDSYCFHLSSLLELE